MENKLYTIQFTHSLMTDLQPVPEQRSQNPEHTVNFAELPKKAGKVQTPREETIQTHGKEHSWKRGSPAPRPTPIHKLSRTPMVWSISTGQLGPAARLCSLPAPAQPAH